ncbi:MAG: C4-dicarboxylic acid transporter DauA [Oceanospirillales bacterium LUC14_002_19_P2]|nr:MAG: C4-dicarboxylic acid transporter DauA [Oceanospirillales bacterium LUC14_002_19_P2]
MFATAIKQSLQEGYRARDLRKDCVVGITVGIVAVPLSMALAIASGAAPENDLYTAIIAGFLIALFGGSRFNITGPTAAFVVILLPITQQYGLGGLMVATIMAGLILLAMGLLKLGKLIEFVPYPVTVGFTAGIGVVIATLQLKDFFGLTIHEMPELYLAKVQAMVLALPSLNIWDTLTASVTLATFLVWRKFSRRLPPHLPALIVGSLCAWIITQLVNNPDIATIGSRFSWSIEGMSGQGIPPLLPHFALPWNLPGPDGQPLGLSYRLIKDLMTAAFAIAMLGAIESLLCAVVADGMTRTRHNPNSELIGQGIGNIVAPFFGGIPATAAIARTATSIRSGSVSPVAAMIHALFVLLSVLLLAPVLSIVPMASLAALLMMVAWNMSEAPHFIRVVRVAPRQDVAVLLTCFALTVAFDMVIAVTVGMLLAGLLLITQVTQ